MVYWNSVINALATTKLKSSKNIEFSLAFSIANEFNINEARGSAAVPAGAAGEERGPHVHTAPVAGQERPPSQQSTPEAVV